MDKKEMERRAKAYPKLVKALLKLTEAVEDVEIDWDERERTKIVEINGKAILLLGELGAIEGVE